LDDITVIQSTVRGGSLALSVVTREGISLPLNSTVKRTISDERN
jgi:hypothetical protein